MLDVGVIHISPYIFKTLFSILFNKDLNKDIKSYIDSNVLLGIEAGIPGRTLANVDNSNYGYLTNTNTGFKECISLNFLRKIEETQYQVKLKNISLLSTFICLVFFIIFFIFIFNWVVFVVLVSISV